MAKVVGPLFSLTVTGNFGAVCNYLHNQIVRRVRATARKNKGKISTYENAVTEAQAVVRQRFYAIIVVAQDVFTRVCMSLLKNVKGALAPAINLWGSSLRQKRSV